MKIESITADVPLDTMTKAAISRLIENCHDGSHLCGGWECESIEATVDGQPTKWRVKIERVWG